MSDLAQQPIAKPKVFEAYTEVVNPQGQQQVAVYVYQAPVRIWHWVNALAIVVLAVTGYLIGSPLPSIGGEASAHFFFGNIRFIHFSAGLILTVAFLGRIYWSMVGNHHARQLFLLPVWSGAWWKEVLYELRWYLFMAREPKKYVGHNPLAQLAMFIMFVLPMIVMILTGLALYAEGLGMDHWLYRVTDFVFLFTGSSMMTHTIHHLGMWSIVIFAMIHIYVAFREDIMSRQSIISTMVSGWRMFRRDGA